MWKNKEELLQYARILEDRSIDKALQELQTNPDYASHSLHDSEIEYSVGKEYKGKGGFGKFIEEQYFHKKNDSLSVADFSDVNVELKVSPLRRLVNKEIRVKERLVLNLINYEDMANETFETSHFKEKNEFLLIVFYFYDATKNYKDLQIDLVDIWETLKNDYPQIKSDWNKIQEKILNGEAHLISEGDTLYLGACTKGASADSSMVKQPYSDVLANQRALCLKQSYINHIYSLLKDKKNKTPHNMRRLINVADWEPLENVIENRTAEYQGLNGRQIAEKLGVKYSLSDKGRYARLAKSMLDISKEGFYELDAADIQVKSVRFELNHKNKEAMSFRNVIFTEIVNEEWEDSTFYHELTSKFIFMVYLKDKQEKDEYVFVKALIWNMPVPDLEKAKLVWMDAKQKVIDGIYDNFMHSSDSDVAHVRPKGKNQYDLMETPQGTLEKKKCFWLNAGYIGDIVRKEIWNEDNI